MAFSAVWMPRAREEYDRLMADAQRVRKTRQRRGRTNASKQEGLFRQLQKCITLLLENPRHRSLQTQVYHSTPHPYDRNAKVFEAYVQHKTPGAYRVFWCYGPSKGKITILAITPHP